MNFVKEWREYRNLSAEALCSRIGMAPRVLEAIESDAVALSPPLASKLSDGLSCSQEQLVTMDPTTTFETATLLDGLSAEQKRDVLLKLQEILPGSGDAA